MNKCFNTLFNFNKCSEICKPYNFNLNIASGRITFICISPRIVKLFATETEMFFLKINIKNHNVNFLTLLEYITRLLNSCPAYITDMYKSFNARFNLNKRSEVGYVRYGSLEDIALVNPFADCIPRISINLFNAEGDSVFFSVNAGYFNGYFVIFLEHVFQLEASFPCNFSEMNKAVHFAQIDKNSEISEA